MRFIGIYGRLEGGLEVLNMVALRSGMESEVVDPKACLVAARAFIDLVLLW